MTSPASSPARPLSSVLSSVLAVARRRWLELVAATGTGVRVATGLLLAVAAVALVLGRPLEALSTAGLLGLLVARAAVAAAGPRRRGVVARAPEPADPQRADAERADAEAQVRARVREELARPALQHRGWDEERGRPRGGPLDPVAARARFEAGEPVTVLVGPPDAPSTVLEVRDRGRQVVVTHLDRLQRPSVRYVWAVPGPETGWPGHRLLLHTVVVTGYEHDRRPPQHQPTTTETHRFTTSGAVRGERLHLPSGEVRRSGPHDGDLQVEDVPRFGAWDALLDRERNGSS